MRLYDDAADSGYTNDTIQTALFNGFSSVLDIVTGVTEHPLMDKYKAHMSAKIRAFKKKYPQSEINDDVLYDLRAQMSFKVPVLPGDLSLVEQFVVDLLIEISRRKLTGDDKCAATAMAKILFSLIIVRTYLDRPSDNDLDIYELVNSARLVRIWTSHEQALAACYGEDDTSINACFMSAPNPSMWKVRTKVDSQVPLAVESPFVRVTGNPFTWNSRPGLDGGSTRPHSYLPPHTFGQRRRLHPNHGRKQSPNIIR